MTLRYLIALSALWSSLSMGCVPPAFVQVANEYDLPEKVLYAVALNESGKYTDAYGFKVWPWALNINNQSYYPESKSQAISLIQDALDKGSVMIAAGVMQVFWKYHHETFKSNPHYALDLGTNLRLGAKILNDFYIESGDIWRAVGQYYAGSLTTPYHVAEANRYVRNVKDKLTKHIEPRCDDGL